MPEEFRDNPAQNRFELEVEGGTAFAYYRLEPGTIIFIHTEVPQALSGRRIGSRLIRGALGAARAQGRKVVAQCPFVSAYLGKHPEFNDLIK
jgi:uncharacterized protein